MNRIFLWGMVTCLELRIFGLVACELCSKLKEYIKKKNWEA